MEKIEKEAKNQPAFAHHEFMNIYDRRRARNPASAVAQHALVAALGGMLDSNRIAMLEE